MSKNDLEIEKKNLFGLIETFEAGNIRLAVQLCKKNPVLQKAVDIRYAHFLKFLGRKTINSLKDLGTKLHDNKALFSKQWLPNKASSEILANLPIQQLHLQSERLTFLPEWVCHLKQVEEIRLQHNALENLPESFCRLVNLKTLLLQSNKLQKLPILMGNLKKMETLNVKNNKLLTLPKSIGNLPALERLDLHNNKLTELPPSFIRLTNLKTLDLSKNKLFALPNKIGDLQQLEALSIHENTINRIPKSLSALKALHTLFLDRKSTHLLPKSALEMNLEKLCIISNSIEAPANLITGTENINIHLQFLILGNSKNKDYLS